MKKFLFTILAFSALCFAQQERVAIINTVDDRDSIGVSELIYLTDRLRETAVNILPKQRYGVMTTESIVAFLGSQERAEKECREASCLAELGRKVSADYVAQARIGRFDRNLTIKTELYNSKSGVMVGSFTGTSKNISSLLAIIDEKAPVLFKKLPGVSGGSNVVVPSVESGISGFEKVITHYELGDDKRYLANISTDPIGAVLSFDGVPSSSCVRTPCKAELRGGNVRIIAALEQYETADTTVSVARNNQNITITLKPNFGVLDIKPAYLDGIGKDKPWDLLINGKPYSIGEVKLSTNKYSVRLNHECYENVGFDVGINKGNREIFDMSDKITLKNGGLSLSAEKNGEPVSEPVFVNGKQVGETPFSGLVPICAEIKLGKIREHVNVKLKPNEKVSHTAKIGSKVKGDTFTDSRDGKKYKLIKIGKQIWMAENLNYSTRDSECYKNEESNCQEYGKLYNWNDARIACPKGWHLPSKAEWEILTVAVGGEKTEGKYLKTEYGWNSNGSSLNSYGFSALPGGYSNSSGSFSNISYEGNWWSASESNTDRAYYRSMDYSNESAYWSDNSKSHLFSVRCLKN